MNRCFCLVRGVIALFFSLPLLCIAQDLPLLNAFAHNDYQHKKPLFDALRNGYVNIEADVYTFKGKLVVTHVLPQIHHRRTLEDLYLAPLANHIAGKNVEIYTGFIEPLTLMIDIKSDPDKSYKLLKPLLEKYRNYLSGYRNGQWQAGPLRIVLSGNKPYKQLKNDPDRLAFIDEDLRRITRDTSTGLFSMASCKFSKLLRCKKDGTFSQRDEVRLRNYVEDAHRYGARVRLWSSPDKHTTWRQLLDCGVDLIVTDKLTNLRDFLIQDKTLAITREEEELTYYADTDN
ncbi:phosphatidylinositol-specific phospholipase C/glycerophosphodiester phosphodiesterase family protein [Mucilaginibacter sp. HD30]